MEQYLFSVKNILSKNVNEWPKNTENKEKKRDNEISEANVTKENCKIYKPQPIRPQGIK